MGLSSALTRLAEDMAAGFKLAARPGDELGMFIGPKYATDEELLNLARAKRILSRPSAARDPERFREGVWRETGWFGWGDDGLSLTQPQRRVSDYGTDFTRDAKEAIALGFRPGEGIQAGFNEIYQHPEMAARAGADLANLPVQIMPIGRPGARFVMDYDRASKKMVPVGITMGSETFGVTRGGHHIDDPRAVLLHELTHFDQAQNGFANGGSPVSDFMLAAQDRANAALVADLLHRRGVGESTRFDDMTMPLQVARRELGIPASQAPPRMSVGSHIAAFERAAPRSPEWYDAHPGRIGWHETLSAPLLDSNHMYRQGGSGRGELPAWRTYYEVRDNATPEQMANVPPFRTTFPQSLHGVDAKAREERIKAIADAIRTAGGLGALSAAVGGASQYAREKDPSGGVL